MSATTSTTPVGVLGEVENWVGNLWHEVKSLWLEAKAAQADVAAFDAAHPEIVAIAQSLKSVAPPAVQAAIDAGLSIEGKVAEAFQTLDAHAASLGVPMAPSTPAA